MVFLATVPACGFHSSSNPNGGQDANGGDATIDATPDASGPEYGTFIKVGFPSISDVPTATITWTNNMTIDTDGSCDTRNNQASRYCVIVGSSITLASGKTLTVHGSKPLVLLATSTFDLEGTIDVSSKRGGTPGAGAATSCPNTTAAAGNSGGFGGSFGGKGGDGGTIAGATPDGTKGIAAPALPTLPTYLRGGCPGGNGSSTTAGTAPAGGSGGGAVLIIAVNMIQMNGTINASGAGGRGGPMIESGGGGGGSGGMIVLDTPLIVPGAGPIWLFANGGGGGQGGTGSGAASGPGADGQESSAPLTVGTGGSSSKSGGNGGDGAAGAQAASDSGTASNSGGGGAGGGGAGFIRTPLIAGINVLISPAPIAP